MEIQKMQDQVINLRPAPIFAFIKITPLLFLSIGYLLLAWWILPIFFWLSFSCLGFAAYRFIYIRNCRYEITPELIRTRQGIFFKRTDQVELYRVKDYILTQPFILQLFRLMDLSLKTTDPENPVLWLRGIPRSDLVDVIRAHVQEARQHNKIYEIN